MKTKKAILSEQEGMIRDFPSVVISLKLDTIIELLFDIRDSLHSTDKEV